MTSASNTGLPQITAFNWIPPIVRGLGRDVRVRWALEEIGQDYTAQLFHARESRPEDYAQWQPFNQIPAYTDGAVKLFETGAILLYLGERDDRLLPSDRQARWAAISWLFAALNSVEPSLNQLARLDIFHADQPWLGDARAPVEEIAAKRLQGLADALGGKEWLAGDFSIADIAMVTVFGNVRHTDMLAAQPLLAAYAERAHARPAYQRALAAHLADLSD